jgi:hypothetical protein
MAILASDIFISVRSFLDDDNSGRYSETLDLVPAINRAVGYLVAVFNTAFDAKKITPESLRELVTTKVLAATGISTKKIDLSTITDLWTILAVAPSPSVTVVTPTPPAVPYDILADTSIRFAKRMTLEEWQDSQADPFSAGTGISIVSDLVKPGYIGPGIYSADTKPYILVRPASIFTTDKAAIFYLKNPTAVVSGSTSIEFPRSLFTLLTEKTLSFISHQHGPESAYPKVTNQEVTNLVSLILS